MTKPLSVIQHEIQRYACEGNHFLNAIVPFRALKNPKVRITLLKRHVEITIVHQNLSDLGLWSEVQAGYLKVLEESPITVKGFIHYLVKTA